MTGQERDKPYQESPRNENTQKPYKNTGKFEGLGELLEDVDKLVDQGNLADKYRQSGGQ